MTKIAFIDRDGTLLPQHPLVTLTQRFYRSATDSGPRQYVRRLAEQCDVRFVWNSRNPDYADFLGKAGRLHSRNKRRSWANPVHEHLELLQSCGIEQEWLLPGFPEVIHETGRTKGAAMCEFLSRRGIPVADSIAFDDHASELAGYPADRVITVDPYQGITYKDFRQARVLLGCAPTI